MEEFPKQDLGIMGSIGDIAKRIFLRFPRAKLSQVQGVNDYSFDLNAIHRTFP